MCVCVFVYMYIIISNCNPNKIVVSQNYSSQTFVRRNGRRRRRLTTKVNLKTTFIKNIKNCICMCVGVEEEEMAWELEKKRTNLN